MRATKLQLRSADTRSSSFRRFLLILISRRTETRTQRCSRFEGKFMSSAAASSCETLREKPGRRNATACPRVRDARRGPLSLSLSPPTLPNAPSHRRSPRLVHGFAQPTPNDSHSSLPLFTGGRSDTVQCPDAAALAIREPVAVVLVVRERVAVGNADPQRLLVLLRARMCRLRGRRQLRRRARRGRG